MRFSGIAKGKEHPSHPPRTVEGEDVPKATRNLAHGQGLDLRKRIAQNLHLASGQKIDRRKGLPRQGARALTPPGQGRGPPPSAPSGCSRAASCGCSGHGLYLGIPARRGLQARDLLAQRRTRGSISSGSDPSSSVRLRHAAESRFRRRHVGDGHLVVARHLLAFGQKESGM